MISQEKSLKASANKGEALVYEYFDTHPEALRQSDTTIYNRMVLETGYKPVNSEVAVYILRFIGEMREIFSDSDLVYLYKELRQHLYKVLPSEV